MTEAFFTLLALWIAACGFLLIIGRGPRHVNKFHRTLGRVASEIVFGLVRGLFEIMQVVLTSVIRLVFERPRR